MAGTQVKMETSMGSIIIELDDKKAPITVKNFLEYVNLGYYEGTVFHRIIPGFMVQGGGFKADFKQPSVAGLASIHNEAKNGLNNVKYSLSMARTNDPHSATSQFFINVNDNTALDQQGSKWGYAVFGRIIKGQQVVDAMSLVKTEARALHQDVPVEDVSIIKATKL